MLILTLPDLLGWVLLACPPSPPVLLFGRLLTGIASGGYLPTVHRFTGQICQGHNLNQLALLPLPVVAFGTLVFYILGLAMHPGQAAAACIAVPTILAVSLLCLADAPAWLLTVGRDHEALAALEKLRAGDTGTAVSELVALQREVCADRRKCVIFLSNVVLVLRFHLLALLIFQKEYSFKHYQHLHHQTVLQIGKEPGAKPGPD